MNLRHIVGIYRRRGPNTSDSTILFGINLVGTLFESAGLSILLPTFQFIQSKGDISALSTQYKFWRVIIEVFQALGVPLVVGTLLAASFICILVRQVLLYVRLSFAGRLRARLYFGMCNEGFERYLGVTAAYRDREQAGDIVNALTTELKISTDMLLSPITLANLSVMAAVYTALMVAISPLLCTAALALFILSAAAVQRLMRHSRAAGIDIAATNRNISAFLVERVKSARLVILSGTEGAEIQNMRAITNRQRERQVRIASLLAALDVVIEPIVVGFGFLFLFMGTTYFALRLEEIGLFMVIVLRLLPVVKDALKVVQAMMSNLGSFDSFDRRLLDMKAAQETRSGRRPFVGLRREIRFDNVEFTYPTSSHTPALRDINLVIPAGYLVALVGPSGAGKSTLIDLLPRLREPQHGVICFDGVPIGEFALDELRRGIAYLPQTPQIFNVTIAEHIRYGRIEATDNEIREAARLAGAAEFIDRLPHGYKSLLGEDGVRLSGGQRQRLDLARALVRRAAILVLDEPTSNLDAESEQRFSESLRHIHAEINATIIVIGHRLSMVSIADLIVVMRNGRIEDMGTHSELLARRGWYADALTMQQHGEYRAREQIA